MTSATGGAAGANILPMSVLTQNLSKLAEGQPGYKLIVYNDDTIDYSFGNSRTGYLGAATVQMVSRYVRNSTSVFDGQATPEATVAHLKRLKASVDSYVNGNSTISDDEKEGLRVLLADVESVPKAVHALASSYFDIGETVKVLDDNDGKTLQQIQAGSSTVEARRMHTLANELSASLGRLKDKVKPRPSSSLAAQAAAKAKNK